MGQYWFPINLDKKEYIHPHKLGCGLKLREQVATLPGTGSALIMLLAAMPEPRGGGDFELTTDESKAVIGRWAGDRIALVGDYATNADLDPEHEAGTIYQRIGDGAFTDITDLVAAVIEQDLGGKFVGDGWRTFTH